MGTLALQTKQAFTDSFTKRNPDENPNEAAFSAVSKPTVREH